MVDAKVKEEASKSELSHGEDAIEKDEASLNSLNTVEEEEDDDEDEYDEEEEEEEEDEEEEEEEEEEEQEEDDEEEPEEEKENDGGKAVAVVNNEGLETIKETTVVPSAASDKIKGNAVKKDEKKGEGNAVKKDGKKGEGNAVKKDGKKGEGSAVKKDGKKGEEPKSDKKSGENLQSKEKIPTNKSRRKNEQNDSGTLAINGDKPESSKRKKGSKRVESMGMVFMCSSQTKADCFRYKILGLPESKKDQVLKIYRGMRLFLFDVDLRLMYGIFKAAGPGGYNIEPKAFKSEFPSQVRFTVLDDCLPLAEENFKSVLKENYYSRNKFEGLLKAEQVKNLCKLFKEMGRAGGRSRSAAKSRRNRPVETRRTRPDENRKNPPDDRRISRAEERRKRRARDEERRPRSPPPREKRRHTDYDRPPVVYDREPLVSRYHPPQPTAMASPVRLYAYERQPLDIPSYVRDHVPEPHTYRVIDRERERDYVPEPHTYRVVDRDRDRELDRVPEPLTYRVVDRVLDRERDRIPEPHPYRVVDRERELDRDPYLAYGREPPPPVYRDPVYTVPAPEYHLVSREYHHPPAARTPEYRISDGTRVASYRNVETASDYRPRVALPDYRSRTHYKY